MDDIFYKTNFEFKRLFTIWHYQNHGPDTPYGPIYHLWKDSIEEFISFAGSEHPFRMYIFLGVLLEEVIFLRYNQRLHEFKTYFNFPELNNNREVNSFERKVNRALEELRGPIEYTPPSCLIEGMRSSEISSDLKRDFKIIDSMLIAFKEWVNAKDDYISYDFLLHELKKRIKINLQCDGDKEIIQKLEYFFEKRLAAEGLSQESESFKWWASAECNNRVGCDQVWDNFQETKDPNLRYCKFCQKNVQSCNTIEELDTCIANNQCVCIRIYESDGRDSNYVGKFF